MKLKKNNPRQVWYKYVELHKLRDMIWWSSAHGFLLHERFRVKITHLTTVLVPTSKKNLSQVKKGNYSSIISIDTIAKSEHYILISQFTAALQNIQKIFRLPNNHLLGDQSASRKVWKTVHLLSDSQNTSHGFFVHAYLWKQFKL